MLPLALICLLQAQLAVSQSPVQLALNSVYTSPPFSRSGPTLFSFPTSSSNVSVSVALCAAASSAPRFFVSNDSNVQRPSQNDVGDMGVYEITLNDGYGEWTGPFGDGGYLAVSNAGQVPFEIGVSDEGSMHNLTDVLPLLGDTTSNQVLIFSPVLANVSLQRPPSYPNYTLPSANLSLPSGDSSLLSGLSLFLAPTAAMSKTSLPATGCAMRNSSVGMNIGARLNNDSGLWLKDDDGWRFQWLIPGLSSETNYTAYVIQDGTKMSGPIYFVTKSVSYACSIVHSLPFCPSIAYSVPIAQPRFPELAYTSDNLPRSITDPLLQTITNFSISLTTFPCGRDEYSPLVSCVDCQAAYRKWLCAIWFPRCSEASTSSSSDTDAQQPVSALTALPASATPRSPGLPPFASAYNSLLPCLETCTAADRACPNFIGFKCPTPRFNANDSYGVGFVDSGEDGVEGDGSTGVTQDRFGNVWCNAG